MVKWYAALHLGITIVLDLGSSHPWVPKCGLGEICYEVAYSPCALTQFVPHKGLLVNVHVLYAAFSWC